MGGGERGRDRDTERLSQEMRETESRDERWRETETGLWGRDRDMR